MPIQTSNVTHNNNGHFYRIAIDIAKEGAEVWDLTPYFKGRVGDDNFGLQIVWYYQGRLLDVTGKTPYIKGNVGHYSFDDQKNLQLALDADAVVSHGNPNDCQANGQATYYFPQQMFMKDGVFKGFIGLQDDNQNLTGVDIWFRVLPGVTNMGRACDFYVDILDKTIADFKEKIRQQSIDFDTALNQELQNEKDLIQQKLDAASGAVDTNEAALQKLSAAVGAVQAQIEANNIVSKQQLDNGIASNHDYIDQKFKEMLDEIGDATPHFIDTVNNLKSTYPNGEKGLWVAEDDGNRYVWSNNQWANFGAYQGQGIKDKYISNRMIADNTIQDNVINTVHLSSIQDSYAYIGEATVWNGKQTDQSVYIGKGHNVAWIKKSTENSDEGIMFPVRLPFVPTGGLAAYIDFSYQTVDADGLDDKVDIWIVQNDGTIIKYLWGGKKNEGDGKIKLSASDFATNNYPQNFSILVAVHGGAGTLNASVRVSYNPDNIEQPIRNYQLGSLISTNHPRTGVWDPESWIDASKVRSSNEDLLSKAIVWNPNQYSALNYSNGELIKTTGDLSYNSGITVFIDADTSIDQYIKIVYGFHGLSNPENTVAVFLGDKNFNVKTLLGGIFETDTAGVITAHIDPREFANYGISNNQFSIIIGGRASVIYVKEIQVSTLPVEKTLPNSLARLHNYAGEPDEKFYGQNVSSFDTAVKATVDGLTLGTSGTGYSGDDGRLKSIQAYVPEKKSYTFTVGKIDQNNLLVSGRTFELPLEKGFNGVDMTGYNIQVNSGEMIFMDLSEAGVYTPDGNHPKYLSAKLRDGSHPSTAAGYTGQMFYDANYLVPFSYSIATKNLPQQISTLQEELTATKDQLAKEKSRKLDVITSPNGKSYRLVVGDDGSMSAISTIPNNAVIFGNSLTLADGNIGMAASDQNHDYYHYVTEYIKSKNPNAKISDRTGMGPWESATTTADREKVFNETTKPLLSADTDLVIIQLGDNVNTPEKRATLEHDAGEFIQEIHSVSPKAKIYWIYGWFGYYDGVFTPIQNACDANGATGIDVNDLNTAENQSQLGATRHGINGETWQITNPGEAIHPGDKGMKAIADRVISNFDF